MQAKFADPVPSQPGPDGELFAGGGLEVGVSYKQGGLQGRRDAWLLTLVGLELVVEVLLVVVLELLIEETPVPVGRVVETPDPAGRVPLGAPTGPFLPSLAWPSGMG